MDKFDYSVDLIEKFEKRNRLSFFAGFITGMVITVLIGCIIFL